MAGFCLAVVLVVPVAGQPEVLPNPPNGGSTTAESIAESPLTTFVFRDEGGNLVEMPNFSFSDFERAYKLLRGLTQQDPRPRYSIQWLSLVGEATNSHAELLLTVRVVTRDRHWVRIPLRLDQAMAQEPLKASDSAEAFLHPEPEGEGYVCYLRGDPDQQHTLELRLLVPLSAGGRRTQFALRLPRATASELKLTVPLEELEAEVSEGTTLLPPARAGNGTELTVLGVGGDFRLLWRRPDAETAAMPIVLQADGTISTRMDGQAVIWNAAVSVRSFGAPFDRFQLRLPPQSKLVPDSTAEYSITAVDTEAAESAAGQMVEVRLDKKTSGPVEVRLAAQRPIEEEPPDGWIDLTGFAVRGAVRQSGHLAVAVPNEWQVIWGPQRGVNRVAQLPEPLRREDVVAGFEYSTQPALLQARLVPKTTRLSADPEYVILVGAERIDLRARLRYSIRGANVSALRVSLPGWQLDDIEPDTLVALDGVEMNEDGDLHIPLLQPVRGDLEIGISAHRETPPPPAEDEPVSIHLPLPRPEADTSSAALVILVPDDNVDVVPDSEHTAGLVRQRSAPPIELPVRQRAPLIFRAETSEAVFAASIQKLPQRIEVSTSSRITPHSTGARVQQQFDYTILHEPAHSFRLEVPASLAADGALEVHHEGLALPTRPFESDHADESAEDGASVILQVELQEPCIGSCQLTLAYAVPLPSPTHGWTAASIPLVAPHDGAPGTNRLSWLEGGDLSTEVADDAWKRLEVMEMPRPTASGEMVYTSTGRPLHISLRVGPPGILEPGTTVVERAWVQTWLIRTDRSDRQDRAVFRLRSSRNRLEVHLPQGIAMEQVFVWLNGERVEKFAVDGTRLYIALPGDGTPRTHFLELGYHFLEPTEREGAIAVELPQVSEQVWNRRMYWQLVLPRQEHIVVAPDGFTSESPWSWTGHLFARQPLMEQPELEQWSGALKRTPVSQDTNRYLFSASGYPREAVLRTANRSWIVLGASGLSLVAGLLLIYVPASRHPATLFAVAIGLAGAGAMYPAPTLLIAQAASLGLGLTLLAGLLERSVARRRTTLPATGALADAGSDSTLTQPTAVRSTDPPSTQTVSLGAKSELPQDAFP